MYSTEDVGRWIRKERTMKSPPYPPKRIAVIPNLESSDSPIRNVLGDPIGLPDPVPVQPIDLTAPAAQGTILRNVLGDVVGEVGPLGTIQPPPKFGG